MFFLRFLHFLGSAMWIGGALAALTVARSISGLSIDARRPMWPHIASLHGFVIAPGAVLTVISGVLLTMNLVNRGATELMTRPGIMIMQTAGIIAGILALFVGVPTANQLAALAADEAGSTAQVSALAARLRKRQAIASTVAGVLALLALYGGTVIR